MSTEANTALRDFIYLDLPKLASIYSQLTGGLVTETEVTSGSEHDQRNIRKYDLKVFKPEFGGTETHSQKFVETRVMHHDLFNDVESLLFEKGYAIDVNAVLTPADFSDGKAQALFRQAFYVRATGWTLIEDYERMKFIAQRHNTICEFVRKSASENIKDTEEYKNLEIQLEKLKADANQQKDRNERARMKTQIQALGKQIDEVVDSAISIGDVDQWIIDGFQTWVDTFMPNAIYFHLYPFEEFGAFHLKANLKSGCFVDGDSKSVDFAYSSRPNVKLSVLGLVTSAPTKKGHPFDPMEEFSGHKVEDPQDDPIGFEAALRGLFRGFEGMKKFGTFERYPNVTIYPLAVFRDIHTRPEGLTTKSTATSG